MLTREFKTPVIISMQYNNNDLSIQFKKGQVRVYGCVPPPIAYGLFYAKTPADVLSFYSNNIKNKYTVTNVINK